MASKMQCAFCVREEMAHRIIAENDLACAFPTNAPVVEGHTIIVPKRHAQYYELLTSDERAAIEELRMQLHHALKVTFAAEGFNYAWNEEEVGGQSIPHFHLHMLPRKTGDGGVHEYDPRQFLYASQEKALRAQPSEEELERIAVNIRTAL